MAKRRKKRTLRRGKAGSSSGGRWLEKQLAQVEALQEGEAYEEAFELLLTLLERYPRHPGVLDRLIDVAAEMENWRAVLTYSELLYPMQRGDERAVTLNNLMAASIKLYLPALAWQTGSMLLADHPEFELSLDVKKFVQNIEYVLFDTFAQIDLVSERFDGDRAKILGFMVEHDRMRFFAENKESRETILHSRGLLAKVPGFIPALNNVSLAYFMLGDLESAMEATREVLIQQPENYHALSNLTRYSFLMGETHVAWEYATTLKDLENDSPERWLKEAEALAYLGDDEGVRAAYLQAQQHGSLKSPLLLHLGATAHYRLGHESKAWALWEKALRIDPSFYTAEASLAERAKAPHERDVGWYWSLGYWFPGDFKASFEKLLPKTYNKQKIRQGTQRLLKQYPQFPALVPHILDRGDPAARQILVSVIEAAPTLDLLQALLGFGLSRSGPDAQRLHALQFLAKYYPDLLPADRKVSVWYEGKQREILLLSFQIHAEANEWTLDDETYNLFMKGHEYLNPPPDLKRAERLFTKIINAYPDFPPAYNQLSLVYQMQDRYEEANRLIKDTYIRFPDYFFARVGVARLYLQEERIDEARELLNPVLQQKKLHLSEFRALAQAEIAFALAIERKDSARVWMDMWEKVERTHPDMAQWKARIESKSTSVQKSRFVRKLLRGLGL